MSGANTAGWRTTLNVVQDFFVESGSDRLPVAVADTEALVDEATASKSDQSDPVVLSPVQAKPFPAVGVVDLGSPPDESCVAWALAASIARATGGVAVLAGTGGATPSRGAVLVSRDAQRVAAELSPVVDGLHAVGRICTCSPSDADRVTTTVRMTAALVFALPAHQLCDSACPGLDVVVVVTRSALDERTVALFRQTVTDRSGVRVVHARHGGLVGHGQSSDDVLMLPGGRICELFSRLGRAPVGVTGAAYGELARRCL